MYPVAFSMILPSVASASISGFESIRRSISSAAPFADDTSGTNAKIFPAKNHKNELVRLVGVIQMVWRRGRPRVMGFKVFPPSHTTEWSSALTLNGAETEMQNVNFHVETKIFDCAYVTPIRPARQLAVIEHC